MVFYGDSREKKIYVWILYLYMFHVWHSIFVFDTLLQILIEERIVFDVIVNLGGIKKTVYRYDITWKNSLRRKDVKVRKLWKRKKIFFHVEDLERKKSEL